MLAQEENGNIISNLKLQPQSDILAVPMEADNTVEQESFMLVIQMDPRPPTLQKEAELPLPLSIVLVHCHIAISSRIFSSTRTQKTA